MGRIAQNCRKIILKIILKFLFNFHIILRPLGRSFVPWSLRIFGGRYAQNCRKIILKIILKFSSQFSYNFEPEGRPINDSVFYHFEAEGRPFIDSFFQSAKYAIFFGIPANRSSKNAIKLLSKFTIRRSWDLQIKPQNLQSKGGAAKIYKYYFRRYKTVSEGLSVSGKMCKFASVLCLNKKQISCTTNRHSKTSPS